MVLGSGKQGLNPGRALLRGLAVCHRLTPAAVEGLFWGTPVNPAGVHGDGGRAGEEPTVQLLQRTKTEMKSWFRGSEASPQTHS